MIAAIVTLALVAAGLGATAAALGIRLSGVKEQLGKVRLRVLAEETSAHEWELEAKKAGEELRQVRERTARIEERYRAELDYVRDIAARCADPAELRRQLNMLTAPKGKR